MRSCFRMPLREEFLALIGSKCFRIIRTGGIDRQPDDSDCSIVLLHRGNMPVLVMPFDEGTSFVDPFEDDNLTFIIGKLYRLAIQIVERKIRSRFADTRRCGEND